MKVNEVRYGNIINYRGSQVTMNEKEVMHFYRFPESYDPIELTEQWLLKFGFNTEYKPGYIGIDCINSDFVLTVPFMMGAWQKNYAFQFETGNVPKFKTIKYVHQLQNLYHALAGEELTIGN